MQEAPHAKPEGQQPPPSPAPQANQPLAQLPWVSVVVAAEAAAVVVSGAVVALPPATIVRPDVTIMEVDAEAGQDVVSQFLPTLQQPPR